MALIKCKECEHEISKTAKLCPNCGAKNKHTSLITQFAFVIVFGLFLKFLLIDPSRTPYSPRTSISNSVPLELLSWSCNQEHGHMITQGEVKNISNSPIKNVVAVGMLRQKDNTLVKSDDALIEYNPILAGQTSPFKVISTHNPAITNCNISFKTLFGTKLNYKNSQK